MTELLTRDEAMSLKLWERELVLKDRKLTPVEPQYAIVWEDPTEMDDPVKVTVPSPMWLAMAMHGNCLPPVSVYPLPVDEKGAVIFPHPLHDDVIPAMTEEEAMEYLLQKDVPQYVWKDATGNAPRFKITKRAMVSTDRSYRNAWRLAA
mgnify:CR=1 FL=1